MGDEAKGLTRYALRNWPSPSRADKLWPDPEGPLTLYEPWMSDPAKEIAELRGEIRMLKALDESAVRKRLDMERDAKALREAAVDVVTWADAIEGPAAHARCIVKRKYIDRLDESLATPTRPQGHTKETA